MEHIKISGIIIPALVNRHSHAAFFWVPLTPPFSCMKFFSLGPFHSHPISSQTGTLIRRAAIFMMAKGHAVSFTSSQTIQPLAAPLAKIQFMDMEGIL